MEENINVQFDVMESGHVLRDAVLENDFATVKTVLECENYDPNEQDSKGRTTLHIASARGNVDIVQLLLKHGADVNITDIHGNTALHWSGHIGVIVTLVNVDGAEIRKCNKLGATPKMMAQRRGVSSDAIDCYEELERKTPYNTSRVQTRTSSDLWDNPAERWGMWGEFYSELGFWRMILLLIFVLFLSLYVAYTVTGFSVYGEDLRMPINGFTQKVEL